MPYSVDGFRMARKASQPFDASCSAPRLSQPAQEGKVPAPIPFAGWRRASFQELGTSLSVVDRASGLIIGVT